MCPHSYRPIMSSKPHAQATSAVHNAIVLSMAQAVTGSIGPIAISLGALAGAYLLPEEGALATLPVATFSIGLALFALPVGMLTNKFGRRGGFILGVFIGIFGALLAGYALFAYSFSLFCLAFGLLGAAIAFAQQYRFAATDQGDDKFKSRAISWVLSGGIVAAVLGPQIVLKTKDMFLPIPFAGAFFTAAGLLVLAIIILMFLKPVPVSADASRHPADSGRPVSVIMRQHKFIVALFCAVTSYSLMTFMMTGAPLAMTHNGHSQSAAIMGIQWHVMAMFAPSFFTGLLVVRFGKTLIIATGLILLIICAAIALSGMELWNFWGSLILLGLGWNFSFIGSTALFAECYTHREKNKIQGLHDCILFSCVAAASLLAGTILHVFSWYGVAWVLVPVSSLSLLSLVWLKFHSVKQVKMSEGL